jgi:hypothetical protein
VGLSAVTYYLPRLYDHGRVVPRRKASEKEASNQVKEADKGADLKEAVSRKKSTSRKEVDLDSWIDRNIDEVISRAGLDYLGLKKETWVDVLKDILVDLYGSTSSYKSVDDIVRRLLRNSDRVFPAIATRLAHVLDNPSPDQLEFIASNVGDSILELAPKIYGWLTKLGRNDLLGTLRFKWRTAWSRSRTAVLPVACPKCGFNALMPDLVCLVCGFSVSEGELKKHISFTEKLKEFLNSLDCQELAKLLKYDYVLVNDLGVKHPAGDRSPIDIEVFLSKSEKDLVREAYGSRCLSEATK